MAKNSKFVKDMLPGTKFCGERIYGGGWKGSISHRGVTAEAESNGAMGLVQKLAKALIKKKKELKTQANQDTKSAQI